MLLLLAVTSKHSPDGSTFLREMTSWPRSWNYVVLSKIQLRQSMRIYLKNSSVKFQSRSHLETTETQAFWRGRPNKKNKNKKMS